MFKKLLDKPVAPNFPAMENKTLPDPFYSEFISSEEEMVDDEEPETTLGEEVSVKGTLSFQKTLRVNGSFEGDLISEGKLIVGPKGIVKANITLREAYISGKVEGDICVKERLVLRGRAEVRGNITAPLLSVDEGVTLMGQLNVVSSQTQSESVDTRRESFQ